MFLARSTVRYVLGTTLLGAFVTSGFSATADAGPYPLDAKPGECYAKVLIPARFEEASEQVLVRPAGEKIAVVEPEYEWLEEQVLVKEPGVRYELVPATYKEVEEQVIVTPAHRVAEVTPAVYEFVNEEIVDEPARTEWKRGRGLVEKLDNVSGEILCLVEIPATYKTVRRQVLKTPATVREIEVPAEYVTIKKQEVDEPARVIEQEVPAQYQTLRIKKLVRPGTSKRETVPAEYETVTRQRLVAEEQESWRPVLCETNMGPSVVEAIQRALLVKGYAPGGVDGVLGPTTVTAAERYQREAGLARGGLTLETLEALGVEVEVEL